MNADERNRRYRALLEGTNAGLLVEIGRETFGVVMRRIEDLPGIKLAVPEISDIADLSSVRNLLVYERVRIGEEEVPLAGVARALRSAMRRRPDALMFRKRCQHLPRLYQVLMEHRNLQQHHVNEHPTTAEVAALCGVILSILDICPLGSDRTEGLKTECLELIRAVTVSEEETDLSTRLAEQQRENKDLKAELARLREQTARGNDASELESLEVRLGGRLSAAVEQVTAEIASSTEKLAVAITLSEVERESLAMLQAESDVMAERMWPDEMLDALESSATPSNAPQQGEDRRREPSDITPSMAEDRLKDLRDKIRREMSVEHWENICMMKPIVQDGLLLASLGEIETLDDWRGLSSVRQRYGEHRDVMERQIARYGEEMLNIYRRVERSP
ncbi:MAG: hypothetical protein F4X99_21160 [Gammaproteobacteria bacterium]|nr:hypothetical protein [Gammaproteobacteria bacterium]